MLMVVVRRGDGVGPMRKVIRNKTVIKTLNFLRKKLFDKTFCDHENYYQYLSTSQFLDKKIRYCVCFWIGASLNEIPSEELEEMSKHDTLSFNQFIRQDFIDLDFYLVREIGGIYRDNIVASNRAYDHFRTQIRRDRFAVPLIFFKET